MTVNCKTAISRHQHHYRGRSLLSPLADQAQTGTKYTCPLAATSKRPAQISYFPRLAPKGAGGEQQHRPAEAAKVPWEGHFEGWPRAIFAAQPCVSVLQSAR